MVTPVVSTGSFNFPPRWKNLVELILEFFSASEKIKKTPRYFINSCEQVHGNNNRTTKKWRDL